MRLVPRQLRKSTFPSSVPYYGGRLTPAVIQGMKDHHPPAPAPAPPPPPPPPAVSPQRRNQQIAELARMRDDGILTPNEYAMIVRRAGGSA
jgi:hypothetical protein